MQHHIVLIRGMLCTIWTGWPGRQASTHWPMAFSARTTEALATMTRMKSGLIASSILDSKLGPKVFFVSNEDDGGLRTVVLDESAFL